MSMFIPSTQRTRSPSGSSFVTIQRRGNVIRARISGPRLGERESQIIAREIHAAIDAAGGGMKHLVLDLSDVLSMSSLGLGMCIDVRNKARRVGAETIIKGLCQQLTDLFRMMKVDRLYVIVGDEAELRAHIG